MNANHLQINSRLSIPRSELRFRFARSGGPGGQNVNKVETQVELLFDVTNSPSLTDDQRKKIMGGLQSFLDKLGVVHIVAQNSRSQFRNREDAVEKFVDKLRHALLPKKKRVPTKVSRGARERRLERKKKRGETKHLRKAPTL